MITVGVNFKPWRALMERRARMLYPFATRSFVLDVVKYAKKTAIVQSSFRKYVIGRGRKTVGIIGIKQMRRVYPYSRNLPRDSGPTLDSEINIQSGEYVRGWYTRTSITKDGMSAGLGNRAEHARYLHQIGGTRIGVGGMRERDILRGITMVTIMRSFQHHVMYYHNKALGQLPS